MNSDFAKISVYVITYKQEKVIGRALDSILAQKEFGLDHIIVCDDCSLDGTWDIIQNYKEKYPEYFIIHKNLSNQGIYGNVKIALDIVKESNTDMVIACSGDDAIYPGFFEAVQNFIKDNAINYKNTSMAIYGDYLNISFSGIETVIKNDAIINYPHVDAVNLSLQRKLSDRSSILSINCINRFDSFPIDRGVSMAEEFCDIQQKIYSDYNYYIPYVGSIYYSGIGVSTKMGNNQDRLLRIAALKEVMRYVRCKNIVIQNNTYHIMKYYIHRLEFSNNKSIPLFFKIWFHYALSGKKLNVMYVIKEIIKMIFTKYNKCVI